MANSYDLIIVGGGIGGSSLAAAMAGAGASVLVLEETASSTGCVANGSALGVVEVKRLGLYDLLMGAGGHHLDRHISYDETRTPAESEATSLALDTLLPDIAGPLCIGHPLHCQTLFDEAARRGATVLRGVQVEAITPGVQPGVAYLHEGVRHEAVARLVIGADGRQSQVRRHAALPCSRTRPITCLPVCWSRVPKGGAKRPRPLAPRMILPSPPFPEGGKVRVYGSYPLSQRNRFAGPDGARRFLDAFQVACSPDNHHIVPAEPAGPLYSFFNNCAWAETPVV
jgi:2-polyprenyl-6-methoxyphenol hydroxylase-like FAD-dependent oxidoreductase